MRTGEEHGVENLSAWGLGTTSSQFNDPTQG
jgi:hypothetical protein